MPSSQPLLDLSSYARRGPSHREQFSRAEVEQIGRTVGRTPEVMVKVLSRGALTPSAVRRHLDYIDRKGKQELETDDGERLKDRDAGEQLVEDWDLDLESDRRGVGLASMRQFAPRLVHKILLSMPPGTPAQGVLKAARNFAREEFGSKHRYALALHTDEPHPHVHLVVKAVSEQGIRLNIKKATLRRWRREFARHLRDQSIPANATERAVRGENQTHKKDGIYRATQRGDSAHTRARTESVAAELRERGKVGLESGKSKLIETRTEIERGWRATSDILIAQGQPELAADVRRFLAEMPPPRTEKEELARRLLKGMRDHAAPELGGITR